MINDLPLYIKNSLTIMFADDSNLVIRGKPDKINEIIKLLEDDLNNVNLWLKANHIQLNIDKTQFMVIGKHVHTKKLAPVSLSLDGIKIGQVFSMKILGVYFDENMTWNTHLNHVTKKCYSSLSQLYPIQKTTSYENRKMLAQAYVLSHINYASSVWLSRGNKKIHNAVNKIIKTAARFVLKKRKYDSITSNICIDLEWLLCPYLFEFNLLIFMFKIMIFSKDGDYFYRYLNLETQVSQSTRSKTYITPTYNTKSNWGNCLFKYCAVKLWYETPLKIQKSVKSITFYKNALCAHYLTKQLNDCVIDNDDDYECIASCIDAVIQRLTK